MPFALIVHYAPEVVLNATFLSESGKRTYIITASRMISGLVRKYRKGLRLVMP